MRGVSHESQENLARLSQLLQETLAGQKIVQAFGMESYERKRFRRSIGDLVHANLKGARLSALASPMVEFLGYASFVPFLFYANRQVQEGLGIGVLVVFLAAPVSPLRAGQEALENAPALPTGVRLVQPDLRPAGLAHRGERRSRGR